MSERDDWSSLAQLDDAELERQLLASAAQDSPPAGASERAFRELARDAQTLAALTALAPLPDAVPPQPRPARAPYGPALAGASLGALLGAGAVALWMRASEPPLLPPLPPRPAVEQTVPELSPEPVPPPAAEAAEPRRGPASRVARGADARVEGRVSSERASQLAREVAALDAARAALAIGAADSALRQIERYHAEFPDGELAADADAVAIEALAAEGDHAALAVAVRRFLARYPRDPHAARVRELGFIGAPTP